MNIGGASHHRRFWVSIIFLIGASIDVVDPEPICPDSDDEAGRYDEPAKNIIRDK